MEAHHSKMVEAMTDVNDIFKTLESQSKELNLAAEKANKLLEDTQRRLADLNTGIEVWCNWPLQEGEATGSSRPDKMQKQISTYFGYAKVGGNWVLAIKDIREESGFYEEDTGQPFSNDFLARGPSPILEQSRTIRLKAAGILPKLLDRILKDQRTLIQKLNRK